MNIEIFKWKWNLCKRVALVGTSFWIVETVYFLIAYGWHWTAINENEVMCDKIVNVLWAISTILFVSVLYDTINYLQSSDRN